MFNDFPKNKKGGRFIGFPNQFYCKSKKAFDTFEMMFKNKAPFFVSTYQFKDPKTPIIDNLFFDIDSYFSVRIPYRNVARLKNFFYKKDVPISLQYSGEKGFHLFAHIKPIIPKDEKEADKIKDLLYSAQIYIAEQIGIEAYDAPTFGRSHFLVRYPTSRYIRPDEETGAFRKGRFYCHYLTNKEFDKGLKYISKVAQEPGIVPNGKKSDVSIHDVISSLKDFKIIHRSSPDLRGIDNMLERGGMNVPTVEALGVPCMKQMVKKSHPTHFERIELVSWLKYMGYSDIAINAFIKNQNWTRYKYSVTRYQVNTIKPRLPKCSFLKHQYGELCDQCTLFKKTTKKDLERSKNGN